MQTIQNIHKKIIFLIFVMSLLLILPTNSGPEETHHLIRRKRYVVFPEGSSFSVALCITMKTLSPDNIFSEGVNWGISYDLPNESKPELEPFLQLRQDRINVNEYKKVDDINSIDSYQHSYYPSSDMKIGGNGKKEKWHQQFGGKEDYYKAGQYYLQRRHRRQLYSKLEVIIDAMGFDGRRCIYRALCEASQRLIPRGKTLVEEMIRVVFALPLEKLFPFEPEEHHAYAKAYGCGRETRDCASLFPECGFSLIDMALGKYNDDSMENSPEQLNGMMLASRFAGSGFSRFVMK